MASCRQYSVGTKQRVAPGQNQVLWHVVKSVTTVAKLVGGMRPLCTRSRITWMGMCCISGCTDTWGSGEGADAGRVFRARRECVSFAGCQGGGH